MKKTHRLFLPVITALLLPAGFGHAAEVVSNLGETGSASLNFGGNTYLAASFTTDNLNYTLNSVTLSLDAVAGSVSVSLNLFADNSGIPTGSALESFTPLAFSSGGNKTFNSTGLSLTPYTTYWLALSGSGSGIPVWFATASTSQTGDWTIGDNGLRSTDSGGTWLTSSDIGKFSVDATPVPEPTTLALSFLFAGCFVARQRKAATRA